MFVGILTADLLLGDVHSLKAKRSVVRPIVAELRRKHEVSAAETGHQDLHRRTEIGLAYVADTQARCQEILDRCERLIANHPEVETLSIRQRFISSHDE